jgi:outer membrane protein assembly factor BamB
VMIKKMKYLPTRIGAALILGSVVIALAACSGSSRVRKPADLVTVTNQFDLQPVWSTSIGSSESLHTEVI